MTQRTRETNTRDERRTSSPGRGRGGASSTLEPPTPQGEVRGDISLLTENDIHLFNEGTHYRTYRKLGSHLVTAQKTDGCYFAVWAPNATEVSVMGDFNEWKTRHHVLRPRGSSGIWEGFIPGVGEGTRYKYHIVSRSGEVLEKADPYAFRQEEPPATASVVWDLGHEWHDDEWMRERHDHQRLSDPMAVYEVHLGSWRRKAEGDAGRSLTYAELAEELADHVVQMGFTHVELLPVMEHPFYGSWGYQTTGYFAPTSRYGSPQDFMDLVDVLHRRGVGVIVDWVPSHFPNDPHGLYRFDGTHLYEHADPRQGYHPDWNSAIFNYGRAEVVSFLASSAMFWLDVYHIDGIRVDAVASMLYLDYSRKEGEWIPNEHGGRENLEAIDFLRHLNTTIYKEHPDVQTIAEESTAWPGVSRPTYLGGLGFGMKWDMGWMHDTLRYLSRAPVHRGYHHGELSFRLLYAFHENFMLPLSHDEVVHGKGSLLAKMPGDDWQRFANLRTLYGYMYGQPGKKLLFMGNEIAQWEEWHHDQSLDWHLLEYTPHEGVRRLVADLNRLHRTEPALHEEDCDPRGFEWIDTYNAAESVLSWLRRNEDGDLVLIVCNFTPVVRTNHRLGVPEGGRWRELLNTDSEVYGGSGQGNLGGVDAAPVSCHGRPWSVTLTLPPLGVLFMKLERGETDQERLLKGRAAHDTAAPPPSARVAPGRPDLIHRPPGSAPTPTEGGGAE